MEEEPWKRLVVGEIEPCREVAELGSGVLELAKEERMDDLKILAKANS